MSRYPPGDHTSQDIPELPLGVNSIDVLNGASVSDAPLEKREGVSDWPADRALIRVPSILLTDDEGSTTYRQDPLTVQIRLTFFG